MNNILFIDFLSPVSHDLFNASLLRSFLCHTKIFITCCHHSLTRTHATIAPRPFFDIPSDHQSDVIYLINVIITLLKISFLARPKTIIVGSYSYSRLYTLILLKIFFPYSLIYKIEHNTVSQSPAKQIIHRLLPGASLCLTLDQLKLCTNKSSYFIGHPLARLDQYQQIRAYNYPRDTICIYISSENLVESLQLVISLSKLSPLNVAIVSTACDTESKLSSLVPPDCNVRYYSRQSLSEIQYLKLISRTIALVFDYSYSYRASGVMHDFLSFSSHIYARESSSVLSLANELSSRVTLYSDPLPIVLSSLLTEKIALHSHASQSIIDLEQFNYRFSERLSRLIMQND